MGKMVLSKKSVTTNERIYKLKNAQLLIAKARRTPARAIALRMSLIVTVVPDLII
jgi:hypothetical protein